MLSDNPMISKFLIQAAGEGGPTDHLKNYLLEVIKSAFSKYQFANAHPVDLLAGKLMSV